MQKYAGAMVRKSIRVVLVAENDLLEHAGDPAAAAPDAAAGDPAPPRGRRGEPPAETTSLLRRRGHDLALGPGAGRAIGTERRQLLGAVDAADARVREVHAQLEAAHKEKDGAMEALRNERKLVERLTTGCKSGAA